MYTTEGGQRVGYASRGELPTWRRHTENKETRVGVFDCDELQKANTQASRDANRVLNAEPESLEADKAFAQPTNLALVSYLFLKDIRN